MKDISRKLVAGVALAGVFGVANATGLGCDDILSNYSFYTQSGMTANAEAQFNNHSECFPGGPVASNTEIAATVGIQSSANSNAVTGRLLSPEGSPTAIASNGFQTRGLAAGSTPARWNVWGSVDQTNSDFSYTAPSLAKQRGDNDILTSVIGLDYAISPTMVVGVSAAFDNGDGSGRNGANPKNKTDTDGYTIAPYIGLQLGKNWALDASAGFGEADYSATGGVKADIDRWFAAANLSYSRWVGNWQYNGKLGYLHGNEDAGNAKVNGVKLANTSTDNTLGRLRVSAQASYWMNGFMPYAGLGYTSNVHRDSDTGSDPLGRDTFVVTLGVNFFSLPNKVTGGIYYEEELDRSHSDNSLISANINFRF